MGQDPGDPGVKIVFVGAGQVFGFHSGQFCNADPKGSEFFVVEPDDRIARLSGLTRISLEEASRTADLAIIMTPSYIRWKVCEPFIRSGIPVVVEKPLTINWEEISLFESASEKSWICPVLNSRLIPRVERMKGECTDPKFVRSWKIRYRSPEYYEGWHGKFATDGGVLAQQGFHCLDLVCWVGGIPVSVKAVGEKKLHQIECEDTARVEIEFEGGCRGEVECTTASSKSQLSGLKIEFDEDLFGKPKEESTEASTFAGGRPGHTVLAERVMEALACGDGPPITVASAVPALRTLHACYVSMDRGGEPVKVGIRHPRLGVAQRQSVSS